MASREMIQKMKTAKKGAGGSAPRIQQGRYRLIVDTVKFPTTFTGDNFIAEFRVKKADAIPGATLDDNATPATPNGAGSLCGFATNPNSDPKLKDSRMGEIRTFVETLAGGDYSDDEFAELLFEVTNEDPTAKDGEGNLVGVNPTRGMEIEVEAVARPEPIKSGKNAGKKFIALRWKHVETTDEQVAANVAFLDGKTALPSAA